MRHGGMAVALVVSLILATACADTPPVTEADGDSSVAGDGLAVEESDASEEQPVSEDQPDEAEAETEADPPTEEAEPETESEQPEPEESALAYFEAFATSRPSEMAEMLDHALEGSPAWTYARVQTAFMAAQQQEGWTIDPQRLRVIDTGVELCSTDLDGSRSCFDFEEMTVSDGKLVTFTADGTSIDDRLYAGATTATERDVSVELLGAYHSVQADSLLVAIDISNQSSESIDLDLFGATYVTPEGRQVTASEAVGPYELRPGASSFAGVMFPAQAVGGTVYLTGWDGNFEDLEWELPLRDID
jgi:hypothetical protein